MRLVVTNNPLIKKNIFTAIEPLYVNGKNCVISSLAPWLLARKKLCPYITITAATILIRSKLLLSLLSTSETVFIINFLVTYNVNKINCKT
ncbi:hypothetical protein VEE20_12150 [Escherichia coli]|nr:hypothetical protein VEE20_12150 [Escherichia coli]